MTAPAGATGRRKQAIARVRIIPGTGRWVVNGRTLEDYFPTRCTSSWSTTRSGRSTSTVATTSSRASPAAASPARPAPCASAWPAPQRGRPRGQPADAEEGRLPHPRPAGQGAEEVRPQEGPQGAPVLQAVAQCRCRRIPGGLSSVPTASVGSPMRPHAELALDLAVAAAHVSASWRVRRTPADRRHRPRPRASGEFLEAAVSRAGQRRRGRPRRRRPPDPCRRAS